MTDSKRTIHLRSAAGTYFANAFAGRTKSRRYQPTLPRMLALEKSPALNEFGTVTAVQPANEPWLWKPWATPLSLGSAR